ncbi:phage major capsid protein [Solibacillus sp. FSL W8-0474]|uniref:phage major capsid protein n=1 Tax=Solibacillus sp. FSL W8-0474 TaxID=2975336 RepID=UPI0030FD1EF9
MGNIIETRTAELEQILKQVTIDPIVITQNEEMGILNHVTLFHNNGESHTEHVSDDTELSEIDGVPEVKDITAVNKIDFEPKRIVTAFKLSKQEILASNLPVLEFIIKMGKQRLFRKAERETFSTGYGATKLLGHYQKMTGADGVKVIKTAFTGTDGAEGRIGVLDQEELKLAQLMINSSSDSESTIVLDKSVLDVYSGDSNSIVSYDNLRPKMVGRLFGRPSYRSGLGANHTFAFTPAVIFTKDAYGVSMSEIKIKVIENDTSNALAGSVTVIVENKMDAKVLNPKGIVALGYDEMNLTTGGA